ncbi:hypothetical protein AY601_1581 [Pedobacter cryoconitis]|uniref:HTH araC/xylS-type domain-containing protein n=1 Tax=Pedobacter cryoconitis TaxID=188932 RepID=A0A127VAW0_9SPHI|nr:helix-turn-helix domain-containing protein [Pedobacter cryoconitis]AMP98496.1 hypothetical protein AY601_1581 [Pedobacter cryoconitis]
MEEKIPKYNIDFKKKGQAHFLLRSREREDNSIEPFKDPHSHNYYCLNLLYEGKVTHFVDLQAQEIQAPALLLLNIDQVHIHNELKDCKITSMAFSADFVHSQNKKLGNYLETVFSQSHIKLSDSALTELDKYVQLIQLENSKGNQQDFEIIKCLLNIILIQCARLSEETSKGVSHKQDLFTHFKEVLKKHYKHNHQVKFYANELNITTEVLNQLVKNASHKTPKQLIDERLFTEAKRLLYWSDITVREVAWELGFETDGYFNRFFKKYAGSTPKKFQNAIHLT